MDYWRNITIGFEEIRDTHYLNLDLKLFFLCEHCEPERLFK